MKKSQKSLITTAAIGMAIGTAAFVMKNDKMRNTRKIKKTAGRALKNAGEFINGISHMMH